MLDPHEGCDDGNTTAGDGCSATCCLEGCWAGTYECWLTSRRPCTCGDGILDRGEECDDGNLGHRDGCNPYCEIESETCGDGVVDEHEQCDDGNTVGGDFCDASCSFEYVQAICGDGVVTSPIEHCDDANSDTGDGCSPDCRLETECGNGVVEGVEECDDGGTVSGDGCSSVCREEFCGDGIVQPRLNEECDAADNPGGYGLCAPGCVLDAHCGDGIVQDAYEDCDDGNHEDCDGCSASCLSQECGPLP